MLTQYVTVLQGTLAPALLIMALNVMLTVGEGRDKPLSAYWRLAGFIIGFAGAIAFAALRASAMINQRTFVNYPTLWCCVIFDIAVFVVVLFARRITTNWHDHRALLDIANAIGALAIASTTFRALPDVILRLTIFVEPGDPIFTSDMLLRALGFALGAATAIVAALIFRTMRSTAIRWSFTTAVLLLIALLFVSHFTDLAQILQSKRIVHFPMEAFLALVWCINHQRHMVIAMVLVFIIPVVASIVMGFKIKPEGANEAIVRSHIAFRRRAKAAGAWSLVAMIGKGERSEEVCEAIVRNGAVYLCAVGGCGALAASRIKSCEVIAFEDLGCESVKRLYVEDFPLVVTIDCSGGNVFKTGRAEYAEI